MLGRGWMQWDADWWPMAALPDLQEFERTHPPGTPVFNEMLFGGFLIISRPGSASSSTTAANCTATRAWASTRPRWPATAA